MRTENIHIRPVTDTDRAGLLALAPRLAEGVAPWRDHEEALAAGRRWLEDSLAATARGDGAVFVAVDGTRSLASSASGRPAI